MSGATTTSGSSSTTFGYTGGSVTYTVPTTGAYYITAHGAQGGDDSLILTKGSLGAEAGGEFQLTANQVLNIAVGGQGANGSDGGGGGGGGSFVTQNTGLAVFSSPTFGADALVIAGGGGGGGTYPGSPSPDSAVSVDPLGRGGGGGSGGGAAPIPYAGSGGGGGGGGLDGDGTGGAASSQNSSAGGGGGVGYPSLAGGSGGSGQTSGSGGGGGFGGGGGGGGGDSSDLGDGGGGGGGGYIGGGGGGLSPGSEILYVGGSGGSSFDSGTNKLVAAGQNSGNGSVTITRLFASTISVNGSGLTKTSGGTSVTPFTGVVISDPNGTNPSNQGPAPDETVVVTPSSTANGTLSDPNQTTDGSTSSNGAITLTGTAGAVTTELDALKFTPNGNGSTTAFTIADTNWAGLTASNSSTSVSDSLVPLLSSISGTQANQATTDEASIKPFANATVTDLNGSSSTDTVTVKLSSTANGTLSDPNQATDGSGSAPGEIILSGSASAVTAALRGLVFTPTPHQVAPGQTVTTGFTIADQNSATFNPATFSAPTVTDSTTSVVATAANDKPTITGTKAGQTTLGGTSPVRPFSGVTITDVDKGVQDSLTITLTGAPGTLSGTGLTQNGTTAPYNLAATSPGTLTSELDALTFTPELPGPGTANTTGFTLVASQTAGGSTVTTTDNTTTVTANSRPPIVGEPAPPPSNPLTLTSPVLTVGSVPGGQTTPTNLYSQVLANVQDANASDQGKLAITGVAPTAGTAGAAFLDPTSKVLTYTADAYNAEQPTDSFTYTAADLQGDTVSGTVTVPITPGTLHPTVLGTSGNDTLTASGAGAVVFAGGGNDTVTVNGAKGTVYGGQGTNAITLNGAQQTVVLEQGGTDNISGFNLHNDVLDLTQVLVEAQKSFNPTDFQVTSSGNNATLSYIGTPSFTGGSALATLVGVGSGLTLQALISDGALKTA